MALGSPRSFTQPRAAAVPLRNRRSGAGSTSRDVQALSIAGAPPIMATDLTERVLARSGSHAHPTIARTQPATSDTSRNGTGRKPSSWRDRLGPAPAATSVLKLRWADDLMRAEGPRPRSPAPETSSPAPAEPDTRSPLIATVRYGMKAEAHLAKQELDAVLSYAAQNDVQASSRATSAS